MQLARMPSNLATNTPRVPPALRLITEAGELAAQLMRRSPKRALEQVTLAAKRRWIRLNEKGKRRENDGASQT
jgi:hypothetical protein